MDGWIDGQLDDKKGRKMSKRKDGGMAKSTSKVIHLYGSLLAYTGRMDGWKDGWQKRRKAHRKKKKGGWKEGKVDGSMDG